MAFQVGDLIFNRSGEPGLIKARDPRTEELTVARRGEELDKAKKYGYINGLGPNERKDYQVIIDEVRQEDKPMERILKLQERIQEIQGDPRKQVLKRYLESEMAHIMNSNGIRLDTYNIDERKLF